MSFLRQLYENTKIQNLEWFLQVMYWKVVGYIAEILFVWEFAYYLI